MHIHVRVRRWVVWWFYVGVICGGVAVANIIGRDLSRPQERILLVMGALHWLLGGVVCWAFEGVRVNQKATPKRETAVRPRRRNGTASDFLLPADAIPAPPKH